MNLLFTEKKMEKKGLSLDFYCTMFKSACVEINGTLMILALRIKVMRDAASC